jgi:hypothetical protein
LKYLKTHHQSNRWTANGLSLTDEALKPTEALRSTIVKVVKFYHPDRKESLDAAQDWFYGKIASYLNLIKSDIDDAK